MKNKLIHIYDEMFQANIYVSYGVSKDDFIKQIKKYLGLDYDKDKLRNGKMAVFFNDKGEEIVWIWTESKQVDILAHEASHATNYILSRAGIKLSDDSDEAFAYYIQYIINKVIDKNKNK